MRLAENDHAMSLGVERPCRLFDEEMIRFWPYLSNEPPGPETVNQRYPITCSGNDHPWPWFRPTVWPVVPTLLTRPCRIAIRYSDVNLIGGRLSMIMNLIRRRRDVSPGSDGPPGYLVSILAPATRYVRPDA
jgi:hypothetical protein